MAPMNVFSKRENNTRHLTFFFPITYGGDPLASFIEVAASGLLALYHFNERISDVVQFPSDSNDSQQGWCNDLKFTIDIVDTKLSAKTALEGFSDMIERRQKLIHHYNNQEQIPKASNSTDKRGVEDEGPPFPLALIGAGRSQVSSPLAILSGLFGIPQISPGSTSAVFENKDQYPLFGRLVPSVNSDGEAAISYLSDVLGVTHIFILYVQDEYGLSYAQAVKNACKAKGMSTKSASFSFADESEKLEAILQFKKSGYRYCFGIFFQGDITSVMTVANRHGVAGPQYFWIYTDTMYSLSDLKLRSKSNSSLIEALSGSAKIAMANPSALWKRKKKVDSFVHDLMETFGTPSSPERAFFESNMPKELRSLNNGTYLKDFRFANNALPFALNAYESVIAVALAACDAQSIVGQDFDGYHLYDSFLRTEFDGVFGRVAFDQETGTRMSQTVPYSLSNIIAREVGDVVDGETDVTLELTTTHLYEQRVVVGNESTAASFVNEWNKVPGVEFIYSDGTSVPPDALPPLKENQHLITKNVLVFGFILCSITMVLSMSFGFWTAYRKESRVIKASQPIFLGMLCLGTFMIGFSIVPMGLQQESLGQKGLDFACKSVVWLQSIGFVVAFSALISKTMRINMIFHAKNYARVTVKPHHVLGPFLTLLVVNITILVLWSSLSLKFHRNMTQSVDEFGRSNESFETCFRNDSTDTFFLSLLMGVHLTSLLYSNYQAYLARDISIQYSESPYIGLSMTLMLQVLLVGIPTLILVHDSPTAKFLVHSSLVTIICVVLLLPIIIPKMNIFAQWRRKEIEKEKSKNLCVKRNQEFLDQMREGDEPGKLQIGNKIERLPDRDGSDSSQQDKTQISTNESEYLKLRLEIEVLKRENRQLKEQCEGRKKEVLLILADL